MAKKKYIVITPVRDEEKFIEKTIQSILSQTMRPIEWIIVNDGSTDNTGEIIDKYANQHNWIKTVHREDRGFRKAGGGVIEAFYEGYSSLESRDWDYIVKLDGDLSFDEDYFAKCFKEFENNPKLGIGGGAVYDLINGNLELAKDPLFHVRGATKIYKRDCWDAIGGLIMAPGWDTLDEVKANMLGYQTKRFASIKLTQHRATGLVDGAWANWVKNGRANYISGYHLVFMMLKCMKRFVQKPYSIDAFGLLYGYMSGYIKNVPQVPDRALINYLRQQQIRRLMFRKSIWR